MMTSVSSINAHQAWLDNSAANVAGVNNQNPLKRESTIASDGANTPQTVTNVSEKPVEIAKEMTDQIMIPQAAEANADAIRTQDEMTGTLLNILA